jgi:N-methylhydantoinase A
VHAIERGKDPRSLPLFAFGGAGPVHGFGVARVLHSQGLLVPFGAGVTSTIGFLAAPLAFDFVRSFYAKLDEVDWQQVNALYAELEEQGRAILLRSGVAPEAIELRRLADLRYVGQGHEVRVDVPLGELGPQRLPQIAAAFDRVYRLLYGRPVPEVSLEVISWRLIVSGPRPDLRLAAEAGADGQAIKGQRPVYFPEWGEHRPTPVYDRYALGPGTAFEGPAIVEERESTSVLPPGVVAMVDDYANLIVEIVSR